MFKITKVNSQIRKSSSLFWYRDKHSDYICNGYWAIKTDLKKEEYRKILSVLVERFGVIPNTGEELKRTVGYKKEGVQSTYIKPDWLKIVEGEPIETLVDTSLTYSQGRGEMRIFKGKDYIHVNNKYTEMVDIDRVVLKGGGALDPVFIYKEDDLFMVLPVRVPDTNEHLKELGNKKDFREV